MMTIFGLIMAMPLLTPMLFDGSRLWMLLPLTLGISIVYKATKLEDLRALPVAALLLWLTIVGGMIAVAIGLYILIALFQ
ncbi:MAG: hypothetical protein GX629_07695 [Phycisphaerae bacterium]|jgi:hypothetical protein|nr:hypothetical protein [Phycisphaerae bacterium]